MIAAVSVAAKPCVSVKPWRLSSQALVGSPRNGPVKVRARTASPDSLIHNASSSGNSRGRGNESRKATARINW
jgi:hypothetical protein